MVRVNRIEVSKEDYIVYWRINDILSYMIRHWVEEVKPHFKYMQIPKRRGLEEYCWINRMELGSDKRRKYVAINGIGIAKTASLLMDSRSWGEVACVCFLASMELRMNRSMRDEYRGFSSKLFCHLGREISRLLPDGMKLWSHNHKCDFPLIIKLYPRKEERFLRDLTELFINEHVINFLQWVPCYTGKGIVKISSLSEDCRLIV